MRIISLDELTDDMVLARPIYQNIEITLLNEGTTHLLRFKEKIAKLGFHYIYVEDAVSSGIEINDVISDQMRQEGQKIAADVMQNLSSSKPLNTAQLRQWMQDMIYEIFSSKTLVSNMLDLKNKDTYTYLHAVNVAVLSLLIGKSMQYAQKQLMYLGTGALLHDIGLLALPPTLLAKEKQAMTPEELKMYQAHPQLGYEMIKKIPEIDAFSKLIVWRHHEQIDGKGYPCQISGDDLHEMVRIVSLCDAYDELSSAQKKGAKMPSYQAIEYLIANVGSKYDKRLLSHFLRCVPIFPIGSTVILNDQRRAIVERQNDNFPTRPVVRLLDGTPGASVDLLTETSVVIAGFA